MQEFQDSIKLRLIDDRKLFN